MQRIDFEWQNAHGKARGGTIGRFKIGYLSNHFIARAEHYGRLVAFVTFQVGKNEWCLDVMRHTNEVSNGTMHALVYAAIKGAQQAGVPRVSLASTLVCPNPQN